MDLSEFNTNQTDIPDQKLNDINENESFQIEDNPLKETDSNKLVCEDKKETPENQETKIDEDTTDNEEKRNEENMSLVDLIRNAIVKMFGANKNNQEILETIQNDKDFIKEDDIDNNKLMSMILEEKLTRLRHKLKFFNIDEKFYKEITANMKINRQNRTELKNGKTTSFP